MAKQTLGTETGQLETGLAAMSTDAAYTTPGTSTTAPATGADNRVINVGGAQGNHLHIVPYGTDANNETLDIAVFGWELITGGTAATDDLYLPTFLGEWGGTLSSSLAGLVSRAVTNLQYFCDDIVEVNVAYDGTKIMKGASADVSAARIIIDTLGWQWIDVRGDLGGSAASWNFLWRIM